jgi:hypothetical protein
MKVATTVHRGRAASFSPANPNREIIFSDHLLKIIPQYGIITF